MLPLTVCSAVLIEWFWTASYCDENPPRAYRFAYEALAALSRAAARRWAIPSTHRHHYSSPAAFAAPLASASVAAAHAFTRSASSAHGRCTERVPCNATACCLHGLERHDLYVYLRAEEDDRDVVNADAEDALGYAKDGAGRSDRYVMCLIWVPVTSRRSRRILRFGDRFR